MSKFRIFGMLFTRLIIFNTKDSQVKLKITCKMMWNILELYITYLFLMLELESEEETLNYNIRFPNMQYFSFSGRDALVRQSTLY